jgi:lipopolysaccharide assembly outer membrane protein LptD (OstA)
MKSIIFTMLAIATIHASTAQAGTVCGTLTKANICHTLQGCSQIFLHDPARGEEGNPYTVEIAADAVQSKLETYANMNQVVCVSGQIGINGDPDLIQATRVSLHQSNSTAKDILPMDRSSDSGAGDGDGNSGGCPVQGHPCI